MERDPGAQRLGESLQEMRGLTAGFSREMTEATRAMQGMDRQAQALSRSLGASLGRAFDKAVFGGARLGEVMRGLAGDVAGRALDLALAPVQGALSGGLAQLVSGLAGGLTGALGFAAGGVLSGGRRAPFDAGAVRAFASGGVVDRATVFPMRGGVGLMGEAGPEAILPLARGPDGRLGVRAGGGAPPVPPVQVRIVTPDPAAFDRSRGQVAAQLARAVSRGARRL